MFAHIDADSFFASVLIRKHPHLRGKPVLALGMGGSCVIAASYEAKFFGVKTGMHLSEALKLVPAAVRMPSDFREIGLASQQIEAILQDHCPMIEQMSIDEWCLDLSSCMGGQPGNIQTWMCDLQTTVKRKTGISVSAGAAGSKLLAKMASEYRKPDGTTIVHHAAYMNASLEYSHAVQASRCGVSSSNIDIESFLRDRPAQAIPGIGRQRSIHTQANNWHTAWDIATADSKLLQKIFGRPGIDMQRELNGECLFPVVVDPAPPKSISCCRSFLKARGINFLLAQLMRHLEYCVLKMRRERLSCRGISIWLRNGLYEHARENRSLPQPMNTEEQIRPYIENCLQFIHEKGMAYTQAGLALCRLMPSGQQQFSLFENPEHSIKDEKMQQALDALHERFGRNAITRATALAVKSGTRRGFGVAEME